MKKICILALSFFLVIAFSGCESTGANKSKSDDEDEYIYVTSTNSRIPKRVKKGSAHNTDSGSSPMGTVSGQKARDYIGSAGSATKSGND